MAAAKLAAGSLTHCTSLCNTLRPVAEKKALTLIGGMRMGR